MKKNIWIMNHYATGMFFNKGGRHYWFADNLIDNCYRPTIFCANTRHGSNNPVEIKAGKFTVKTTDKIPFVFVKTSAYDGNGLDRIKNMVVFYKNLFPATKEYAKLNGRPDIILASSVHPLTLVAGIKIAKKFDVPCICEVRDLWPETFVAYDIVKKNNPILKLLYAGEKWIYKKADRLIFTMEGGREYIIDKKWDIGNRGPIDLNKVYYINNGVDIEEFNYNKQNYTVLDEDLNDDNTYKVIYTGSLGATDAHIWELLKTAELLNTESYCDIKFLIYGGGSEKDSLEKYCLERSLGNVYFKGRVAKKYIPYVLSKANINILNCVTSKVFRYGGSQNKLFEYLASEHPIITAEADKYSIVKKYNCGIAKEFKDATEIKEAILELKNLEQDDLIEMKEALHFTALKFDFRNLTDELIKIIEC